MNKEKQLAEILEKELNGIIKGYERKYPDYEFDVLIEDVYVEKKAKTLEQYTKEELLEIIKKSLLTGRKRTNNLKQLRDGGSCNPIAHKLIGRSVQCIDETLSVYDDLINLLLEEDPCFSSSWHVDCEKPIDLDKFFDGKE